MVAAWLTMLLATTLLAAGPIYSSGVSVAGLRQLLAEASVEAGNVRVSAGVPLDRVDAVDQQISAELNRVAGTVPTDLARIGTADAPLPPAPARLLPSGDAYWLLQGADRELLVPDADHRLALWTPRVWPGALLVEGDIVGTWRRAQAKVTIETWRRLSVAERAAVEAEAASLPLPGVQGQITVRWEAAR